MNDRELAEWMQIGVFTGIVSSLLSTVASLAGAFPQYTLLPSAGLCVGLCLLLAVQIRIRRRHAGREAASSSRSDPNPSRAIPAIPPPEDCTTAIIEGIRWRWTWYQWPPAEPLLDAIDDLSPFCKEPGCGRRLVPHDQTDRTRPDGVPEETCLYLCDARHPAVILEGRDVDARKRIKREIEQLTRARLEAERSKPTEKAS